MKKNKNIFSALVIMITLLFSSCTENERVKNLGGSGKFAISPDEKFVNVTWKETQLWVLTRIRTTSDTTYETYKFREKSNYGVIKGVYTIEETRQ